MAYNPSNQTFDTLADLSTQVGTMTCIVQVIGGTAPNDGNGGMYYWDTTSVETPDGLKIIQVTNVTIGRWKKSKSNTFTTGSSTFSGLLGVTTYTITHGLGYTPVKVFLQARNAVAASGNAYVTNITTTTFQINFLSVPVVATNNITFDYLALKIT